MRISPVVPLVLVAALLFALPVRSQAISCEPASSPLLKVIAYTVTQGDLLPSQSWSGMVLCKDGRLVTWGTEVGPDPSMPASPPPFPFAASLQVGSAAQASFAQLQAAMSAAEIGQIADCSTGILASEATSLDVTWYGRQRRQLLGRRRPALHGAPQPELCRRLHDDQSALIDSPGD
jgi:hypothetical protein